MFFKALFKLILKELHILYNINGAILYMEIYEIYIMYTHMYIHIYEERGKDGMNGGE